MTLNEFLKEWHDDSDRVLVHTSGSTGKPKPMWVEKRRMVASACTTCDFLGLKPADTALLCMSLDYIAGKMMVVRALVRDLRLVEVEPSGHPLASLSRGNSSNFTADIPLDFAAMVPMQVYNSLRVKEECERLMRIRHLLIGGGAIDEEMERQLRVFPHAVWSSYGMTETLSHIALRRVNGNEASEWYTPLNGVDVSLNAEGCLVIDAPHVCDNLLVTNDRAELSRPAGEASGRCLFRILGRMDNVVCCGGVKIQMEEVERMLRPHICTPYLITKQKDRKFGEIVVLLTEQSNLSEVESICEKVLPKYWKPRRYIHVDRIPLTETGKPARAEAEACAASAT